MTSRKTKEKFLSRKIIAYQETHIYTLRENVKSACNYLDPKKHFDFNQSKQTFAYQELSSYLEKFKYPDISIGTLHNFFTNQSVDNDGVKVFRFQQRTIEILEDFSGKNLPMDLQSSNQKSDAKLAFEENSGRFSNTAINQLLYKTFMEAKGIISAYETITVMENGDCTISVKRYQEAHSYVTHILTELYMDKEGKVKVLDAVDLDTKEKLEIHTYKEEKDSYSFFMIFPDMKKSGNGFNYSFFMYIENYFAFLVEKKSCIIERSPYVFRYKTLNEDYVFPNTLFFESLKVVIKNHPNKALVNKKIKPTVTSEFKIYKVDNGDMTNFDTPIILEFTLD